MGRQSDYKAGERLSKRAGLSGGSLNRRRQGTVEELDGWIRYYRNAVARGEFCPVRAAKIIARFERAGERKLTRRA
jgi:hypothetical protein